MNDIPFELTDREMLEDLAASQDHITNLYNSCLGEAESNFLREYLQNILNDEHHNLQLLQMALTSRGWKQSKPATKKRIKELQEIYINIQNAIQ